MQNKLKISDPTKIVTLANMISLLRAVLAVPIVYTLTDPSLGSITLLLILNSNIIRRSRWMGCKKSRRGYSFWPIY